MISLASDDSSSFEQIFHAYKNRIVNYVLTIVKTEEAAKEVTQEIMIKLWLCREALDKINNLDGYIYTIARNKALNHLRKAAYDVKLLAELSRFAPQQHNNTDDRISLKDYEQLLKNAVNTLSGQRRQVYQLSRVEGLSHEQIAQRMHLSKKTVKNHLVAALKLIRQHLQQTGGTAIVLTLFILS